jgi:hypothetical protein
MVQFITGNGPTATNTDNDHSTPCVIPSDTGIIPGTRMLPWQGGAVLRTPHGLSMLTLSMQIDTEWGNRSNEMVGLTQSATVVDPSHELLYFAHSDGDCYAYNYCVDQWARFTNHNMVSATMFGGVMYWATSAGLVRYRNSTWLDGPTAVVQTVETPWIKLSSIQGYQRVYNMLILGEYRSAHKLTVNVYYDFSSTASETVTFDLTTGYTTGQVFQLEHYCGRPCDVVKVKLNDGTTTAESVRLSGIAFEIGQKYGANKIVTTRKG